MAPIDRDAPNVFYISAGTETSAGTVYQVDETGRVLGKVALRYTASGMALHPTHGLILAVPRDGGKIMQIDGAGKLSTLLERDPTLPHPIDIATVGPSEALVVADNITDTLVVTSMSGKKPRVLQHLEGDKYTSQGMSVAVTKDKQVVFSSDGKPGVFRFGPTQSIADEKPILPTSGGVAADPNSLRWAASQDPNLIYIYEADQMVKKLRLPPGKSIYRNGLLSFSSTGSLCVAVGDSDKDNGEVWLLMYDIEKDEVKSLFPWQQEPMQDFVAGPRMPWDRRAASGKKSTF